MTRKERKALKRAALTEESLSDPILRALVRGNAVSREQAMSIPAVASSVDYVSSIFAMLPIKLYRETIDDKGRRKTEEADDYRVALINDDTRDALDGFQFKKAIATDYLLGGGGYAYINKAEGKNKCDSLNYVKNESVLAQVSPDPIFKNPTLMVGGKNYFPSQFIKVLRNTRDGVKGYGIVDDINKALTAAYKRMEYEVSLSSTGGSRRGFIKSQKQLDEKSMKALQTAWQNYYDGNINTVILNNGLEFQEASCNSRENQVNEKDVSFASDIKDLFHIGSYEETIKSAVMPIAEAFCAALNRDLLLEKEKKAYYFAPDTKEMLKGSMLERFQAYQIGVTGGWLTENEVRYLEDMNAIEGLDVIKFTLADSLLDARTGLIYTPNTGEKTSIDSTAEEVNEDES